jgi:MYXO-CTERM domain-containing protein
MRAINVLSALAIITAAPSALALAGGQGGSSGRPNGGLCNRCHGTQTYEGLDLSLVQGTRKDCYSQPGGVGTPFELTDTHYILPYSQTGAPSRTTLHIEAVEPPQANFTEEACTTDFRGVNGVNCPPNQTCCLTEGHVCSGGFCIQGESSFCPADSTCGGLNAGFDVEVVGQGTLEASDPGSQLISETDVAHNAPKAFAGGVVSWDIVFQAPEQPNIGGPQSTTLYAAINACNANGVQDPGDITALTQLDIYFSDVNGVANSPECIEASPACETVEGSEGLNLNNLSCCPDEQEEATNDDGTRRCKPVGGCTHLATPKSAAAVGFAGLLVLGGIFARRRRR